MKFKLILRLLFKFFGIEAYHSFLYSGYLGNWWISKLLLPQYWIFAPITPHCQFFNHLGSINQKLNHEMITKIRSDRCEVPDHCLVSLICNTKIFINFKLSFPAMISLLVLFFCSYSCRANALVGLFTTFHQTSQSFQNHQFTYLLCPSSLLKGKL